MFIFVANDAAEDATGSERAGRVLREDARDVRASPPPAPPPVQGHAEGSDAKTMREKRRQRIFKKRF